MDLKHWWHYMISMQIWGGHFFKAGICKSRHSITQKRNDHLSIKVQNCWHSEHCTQFPLPKQYMLNIIQHSAHHILPPILKFCCWPHVQSGAEKRECQHARNIFGSKAPFSSRSWHSAHLVSTGWSHITHCPTVYGSCEMFVWGSHNFKEC
jgi:hypothetical protein